MLYQKVVAFRIWIHNSSIVYISHIALTKSVSSRARGDAVNWSCPRVCHFGAQGTMVLCLVIGCSNRSDRDKHVSFYRILAATCHYGEGEFERSVSEAKSCFFAAILRDDLDVNNLEKYWICSRHFVSSKLAKALDETDIDWVPTLYIGHTKRRNARKVISWGDLKEPGEELKIRSSKTRKRLCS